MGENDRFHSSDQTVAQRAFQPILVDDRNAVVAGLARLRRFGIDIGGHHQTHLHRNGGPYDKPQSFQQVDPLVARTVHRPGQDQSIARCSRNRDRPLPSSVRPGTGIGVVERTTGLPRTISRCASSFGTTSGNGDVRASCRLHGCAAIRRRIPAWRANGYQPAEWHRDCRCSGSAVRDPSWAPSVAYGSRSWRRRACGPWAVSVTVVPAIAASMTSASIDSSSPTCLSSRSSSSVSRRPATPHRPHRRNSAHGCAGNPPGVNPSALAMSTSALFSCSLNRGVDQALIQQVRVFGRGIQHDRIGVMDVRGAGIARLQTIQERGTQVCARHGSAWASTGGAAPRSAAIRARPPLAARAASPPSRGCRAGNR